ncbi:MAG: hypothetical protein KBC30_07205 [Planctomycetes bacterium]|nr:hypothetical protein [Planctomycetota bacterium]HNZ65845.1 hypothetical protein [Planctomycetota bacterium]HON43820.1 hypothetical protein [Planctomycetota bacterium]HPY74301.1 hypothetical protein [Planctomycetota bacterium]HQA99853.1 hypothetical protein [Planctomycetota bacterium]
MTSYSSLESQLQTLINTPETDKVTLLCSLLKALREACVLFKQSSFSESQEAGKNVQEILDEILSGAIEREEEEWEDEFADSGCEEFIDAIDTSNPNLSISTYPSPPKTVTSSKPQTPSSSSPELVVQRSPIGKLIYDWNSTSDSWLKLPELEMDSPESVYKIIQSMAGLRHNVLSNSFDNQASIITKYDTLWAEILNLFREQDYYVHPGSWDAEHVSGRIIYTCRTRINAIENELICPGLNCGDEILQDPIWVVNYPSDVNFPNTHPRKELPSHWRGIFGEIEILLEHIKLQNNTFAGIEGVNKNKVETLEESCDNVMAELMRRSEVLESTIQKEDENLYRIATDYWRIEECFWSLFHDDNRPSSCSIFDKMRNRLQSWRPIMRKNLKLHIRDFAPGADTLASINQYIGNIIIKPKQGTSPGTVIRELRPAIMVKIQNTSRVLKGRVIAT